jgi:hypothetical protein
MPRIRMIDTTERSDVEKASLLASLNSLKKRIETLA